MKKIIMLAAVIAAVAAAGTSFALFSGDVEKGEAVAEALYPRGEVQTAEVTGAGDGSGRPSCSCCGPAKGAGAGGQAGKIEAYLKDYYTKTLGPGISVKVTDLGCHHEAEVLQNNQVIKRLSINGGTVTDIT